MEDSQWQSMESDKPGEIWCNVLARFEQEVSPQDILALLLSDPLYSTLVRIEQSETNEFDTRGLIPRTRIVFSLVKARDIRWDVLTAAGAYVLSGSTLLTVAAGLLTPTVQSFTLLTPDELEVVLIMKALCGDLDHRKFTLRLDQIQVAAGPAIDMQLVIYDLEAKRVVRKHGDAWRLLP